MQTASMNLTITTVGMLQVTAAVLPTAIVGTPYSYQFAATGGTTPYSWAITSGAPPAGLTLSSGGLLSGTPTAQGSSTFTITATDSTV